MQARFLALAALVATPVQETKLVVTGSSTVAPLFSEIAKRYEQKNPGMRIDVQTGGSGRGIADAQQGLAAIGMSSRALKPEETAGGLVGTPIAKDGIGIILHKDNPVKALDREKIVAIYSGTVRNWKEIGGKDAPITVVNKAEGRATLELFLVYTKLKATDIMASVVIGDNQQGIKTVAGNPDAIGYVSIGSAEYDAANGVPVKLVTIDGIEASTKTVTDGTFPLARELYLVTKGAPSGSAAALVEFARSPEVSDLVKAQFFVPSPRPVAEGGGPGAKPLETMTPTGS